VDVVIPVFNGSETIHAAITSVLMQQGSWLNKVIVIDDGSTDGTAEVVQRLGNPSIELVTTPNQGVAAARNIGVSRSVAEWIAFLDADDLWMPNKLQAQLDVAELHGANFVFCSATRIPTMPSGPISARQLARSNGVVTSSVLIKREILELIGTPFTPGMSFAEDYLCWMKCASVTSAYYISEKYVEYVLSPHPRYRWRQILTSIAMLNVRYAAFLKASGVPQIQRLVLAWTLFLGSLRSIIGIARRFVRSYRAYSQRVE
jgi:glycosyltransferase involved in cell wall biosynthesis